MAYTTAQKVSDYTGIAVADLPDDIDRLIDRADDVIDFVIKVKYDITDTDTELAIQKASSAQIEYWLLAGEDEDISEVTQSFKIGSFSMDAGGSSGGASSRDALAPRAYRYLLAAGLLYSGRDIL